MQISQRTPNVVKIGQKHWVCFVADNIDSPGKHFCATPNIPTLLTVTRSSTVQREWVVNFHCKNGYAEAPQSYVIR